MSKSTTRLAIERGAVDFENTTIQYTITRSPRRKQTIGISLDHGAGVLISAPVKISEEEIRELVLARARWIVQKSAELARRVRPRHLISGESLLYLGSEWPLIVEHASPLEKVRVAIRFEQEGFTITTAAGLDGEQRRNAIEAALVRWYQARAAEHLTERVGRWSRIADLTPSRILVRNQRRRWGSCSPDGSLRFNWRIIMAPPAIVDYLVVHELAHLRVRNHSPAYWAEVERLIPDYKARRAALREMEVKLRI